MNVRYAKTLLLGAIGFSLLISMLCPPASAYPVFVACNIGIAIIMAVSLNLINGYTGQFSLGHAGFMAVGAYVSAVITNHFGDVNVYAANAVFALALAAGGLAAAASGLLVGIPTLRLRGDYLAIVTLGF